MKKSDLTKPSKRHVFNIYLIGSNQSGKSTFLDTFIRAEKGEDQQVDKGRSVVDCVPDAKGQNKHLIVSFNLVNLIDN